VDVGEKPVVARVAVAEATLVCAEVTIRLLKRRALPKGDVLAVARVAGIQAAKRTAELIPMCHPLGLDLVEVDIVPAGRDVLLVTCTARLFGKTGVEMEALVGASLAALTLYDMTKALDAGIVLEAVRLVEKRGGRRGVWRARGLSAKRGSRIQTGS
jgi:cyclic pyranopterin phosphate synthase